MKLNRRQFIKGVVALSALTSVMPQKALAMLENKLETTLPYNIPVGYITQVYIGAGPKMVYIIGTDKGPRVADGKGLPKDHYPELYKVLRSNYGETESSFNLPDFRGRFIRGKDNG